jgi:hypothetical protein
MHENELTVDLLIEDAGAAGCLGHIPDLPGLSFRGKAAEETEAVAPARIEAYVRWVLDEGLDDLTLAVRHLTGRLRADDRLSFRIRVAEHVPGAPVWESGNAAALFERDLIPMDDDDVAAHLRFTGSVLGRIRETVVLLSPGERARRPAPSRRSIDETLEHVGNCVWWYCSRIDDELPEPDEPPGEDPLDRVERLFEIAEAHLMAFPFDGRSRIHVPSRFPTKDPNERWTHAKVCRREAEHAWAHLRGQGLGSKIR